jgi:hypothetical protein
MSVGVTELKMECSHRDGVVTINITGYGQISWPCVNLGNIGTTSNAATLVHLLQTDTLEGLGRAPADECERRGAIIPCRPTYA